MNISEIIKEYDQLNITLQLKDLIRFAKTLASETAITVMENHNEKLFTPSEVIKLLHISKPTLWRWEKQDIIKGKKIGNRKYYPESEIKRLQNL